MAHHGELKLGSQIQRIWDARKGIIESFDSFNTVQILWSNEEREFLVPLNSIELSV